MRNKDIENSLKWNKRFVFRLIMELLSVAGPFLCVIFISWLVYYLVSGSNKAVSGKPEFNYPFVCERFFSSPKIVPITYYPFLRSGFKWGGLRVRIPHYWINFMDKRYGGQTLTLQPAESSMFGIHIQVSGHDIHVDNLPEYGREFVNKIGFRNNDEYTMKFLNTTAYCFDVFYLAPGAIPMKSQFVFIKKGDSLIHIIVFAPKYIFEHRLSLFYAVIDSLEYDNRN